MEIGDRLRVLLDVRNIGYNHLDRDIGQGSGGYTTRLVRNEKKRPDMNIIRKIAEVLQVDFEWLAWGKGEAPEDVAGQMATAEQLAPRRAGRPATALAKAGGPAASSLTTSVRNELHYELEDRYPNRDAACALLEGKVESEVLAALRKLRLRSDQDWSVSDWMRQASEFREHLLAWSRGELGPGDRDIPDETIRPNVSGNDPSTGRALEVTPPARTSREKPTKRPR